MKRFPIFSAMGNLGMLAFAAIISLGTSSVLAQEKAKLRISIIPIVDVAPLFAAIQEGYFRVEGLEIDTAPVMGGAVGVPGLVAGAYDIVFTNVVSTILAKQQGIPIKIIAPASSVPETGPANAGIITRKADGLKAGSDFAGKSLAVNTQNNIIWLYARAWIKKTGGDPSKVIFREVPFPQMLDALRAKQIDAAFAVPPFVHAGLADPLLELVARPYEEVQPRLAVAQYVVTEEFIVKNPGTVKRFSSGLHKGIEWVAKNLNKPEYYRLLSGYTRMSVELLTRMPPAAESPPRAVDVQSIAKTIVLMKEHGLLRAEVDPEALVHPTAR